MDNQRTSSDSESSGRADSHLTRTVPVSGSQASSTGSAGADENSAPAGSATHGTDARAARSQSSRSSSSILVAIAAVLAVVLAFAAGVFVGRSTAPQSSQAQGEASSQTQDEAASQQGENSESATTQQQLDYAPSQTNEEALKILADEPRRDPNDPMARGEVDAPVVMVEYSDYSCPMCAKYAQEVEPKFQELIDNGTLRIEYRDMVIFSDKGSDIAAAAARAAGLQGKYVEFHEAVFAQAPTQDHASYTEESVTQIAEQVGVADLDQFRADLTSEKIKDAVQADTQHGKSVGLTGTPSFFINNAYLTGVYPVDYFIRTIKNQAAEAGKAIEPAAEK